MQLNHLARHTVLPANGDGTSLVDTRLLSFMGRGAV